MRELSRRQLLISCWAAGAVAAKVTLSPLERVNRALRGQEVDRPPFSLWHHFGLEKEGPARHAEATLQFHRAYGTDFVKVMSDFPFPKPQGAWWEVREHKNPFAPQVEALRIIGKALGRSAHFVETIFNPWNVAEKLSSRAEVQRLMREQPQKLTDALQAIAKSEANHARLALEAGAAGIFLAIANADPSVLSREEYLKFSAPFDRMVLEAVGSAPLNILHIHGPKVYLDVFYRGWAASVLNYSTVTTGISLAEARRHYEGVLAGGIDEIRYRSLSVEQLRTQAQQARQQAGAKFLLTPGCSVPNEATPEELRRLRKAVES